MKNIIFTSMLVASLICCSCATENKAVRTDRGLASSLLQDVPYDFDKTKLVAAGDAFHFLRSYVDYFYLLVAKNQNVLTVSRFQPMGGWCVGDAHPENFGVLLQKGGAGLFTMNDMDDAGPCPVAFDLLRFMVAADLYSHEIKVDRILNSYLDGLQGRAQNSPASVSAMIKKSESKGEDPDSKKVSNERFVREDGAIEVAESLTSEIRNQMGRLFPKYEILDLLQTSKVGGGSGGLTRYEVLLKNQQKLRHIELKEEVRPSIYPVATSTIPSTDQRLQMAMTYEQGSDRSSFYSYVQIGKMEMLVRPRFDGNTGVNLKKQSLPDNQDIIYYEAFVLGSIHRKSVPQLQKYIQAVKDSKSSDWVKDTDQISGQIQQKYQALLNH